MASKTATPPYPSSARIADSPCYPQYSASLKCLEQYNSDKSKCQEHFDVYKECKKKEISIWFKGGIDAYYPFEWKFRLGASMHGMFLIRMFFHRQKRDWKILYISFCTDFVASKHSSNLCSAFSLLWRCSFYGSFFDL
ncbi:hypothetical protein Ancab_037628 [Ancistrocladus abbreviatus]